MRFFFLFAGLLLLFPAAFAQLAAPADSALTFAEHDFMAFRNRAMREGKCYMVYFSREKCIPCERLRQETFSNPDLIQLFDTNLLSYHAAMSDLEALEIASSFDVTVAPTLIFFRPNGEIIGKLFGYQTADKLIWLVEHHMVAPVTAGQAE